MRKLHSLFEAFTLSLPKTHYYTTTSPANFNSNPNPSLVSSTNLIKSFFNRGAVVAARQLFDEMPKRDVVVWTTMITGYTSNGQHGSAWVTFKAMLGDDVSPNAYTLSSMFKVCKGMEQWALTAALHAVAVRWGVDKSTHVENALLDAYAAVGGDRVNEAWMVFERMEERSVVAWTTMIASCTRWGDGWAAIRVFQRMVQEGIKPNPFTSSIAIHACTSIPDQSLGVQIHAATVKSGNETDIPVANSFINMYFQCHCLSEAKCYFAQMPQRDLITWNTMIAGLSRSDSNEAFSFFLQMSSHSIEPDCFTFTSIISSLARNSLLNPSQQVHGTIIRRGFARNQQIANALINMYTKCGGIYDSTKLFNEIPQRDLVSYTSLMIGYGYNGYAKEAMELFEEMIKVRIQSDSVVFTGLLSACSHSGMIDEGLKYFKSMRSEYNIQPDKAVYGCVVDLLGRAGRVMEAYRLLESMPFEPDETIWGALLGACKVHGNVGLGRLAAQRILDLKPEEAKTYVSLSNLYAIGYEWGEAKEARRAMRESGSSRKEAGRSWVEVKEDVYSFVAGDRNGSLYVRLASEVLEMLAYHMDGKSYLLDL